MARCSAVASRCSTMPTHLSPRPAAPGRSRWGRASPWSAGRPGRRAGPPPGPAGSRAAAAGCRPARPARCRPPTSPMASRATITAWPVPSCGSWTTARTPAGKRRPHLVGAVAHDHHDLVGLRRRRRRRAPRPAGGARPRGRAPWAGRTSSGCPGRRPGLSPAGSCAPPVVGLGWGDRARTHSSGTKTPRAADYTTPHQGVRAVYRRAPASPATRDGRPGPPGRRRPPRPPPRPRSRGEEGEQAPGRSPTSAPPGPSAGCRSAAQSPRPGDQGAGGRHQVVHQRLVGAQLRRAGPGPRTAGPSGPSRASQRA